MSKYIKPYTSRATLDHARPCPCCKRPAKKVTSTVRSDEPYDGNMVLVRSTDFWKKWPDSEHNFTRYEHVVWDGETYAHPYGFFCSQPCAVYYANNGEALHFHGKMFNELAETQPIRLGVYEIEGDSNENA